MQLAAKGLVWVLPILSWVTGVAHADSSPGLRAAYARSACVVEGTIVDIQQALDDYDGPQTMVTLKRSATHLGACTQDSITMPLPGGPLPDGKYYEIEGVPEFVHGGRYIVFLARHGWRMTPVVHNLALRVESIEGREILVDDQGFPVTGISSSGSLARGPVALFQRGASHVRFGKREPTPGLSSGVAGDAPSPGAFVSALKVHAKLVGANLSGLYLPSRTGRTPWNVTEGVGPSIQEAVQ